MLGIRLTPSELMRVQKAAEKAKRKVGDWGYLVILAALGK